MFKSTLIAALLSCSALLVSAQELEEYWNDVGPNAGGVYGKSIACNGDINGDGYYDLAIGEPNSDKVYVYYGNPYGVSNAPDITLNGPSTTFKFGMNLSSGDLDGDGFADLAVSYTNDGANGGCVYLYFGSSTGLGSYYIKIEGISGQNFGWSTSMDGDFDGNGNIDLAIGAPAECALGTEWTSSTGGSSEFTVSGVYVFYGENIIKPTSSNIITSHSSADWSVTNSAVYKDYGWDVALVDDISGDGISDLIVGDPYAYGEGRVFVYGYFGGTSPQFISRIHGITNSEFGKSLSGLPDITGDGRGEIIIGAPAVLTSSLAGKAYIYLGASSASYINNNWETLYDAEWTFTGISGQSDAYYGFEVGPVGDVTLDGIGDFAISAKAYDNGSTTDAGLVRIYAGTGSTTQPSSFQEVVGTNSGDQLGQSFTSYRPNDRFRNSVVIGIPWYDDGSSSNAGRVEMYSDLITNAFRGRSLANLGDINNDGIEDLAVGLHGTGQVEVYTVSSSGAMTLQSTINHGGNAGISLAAVDLDQDGDKDLIIGDDEFDNVKGIMYIHFNNSGNFPLYEDHSIIGVSTNYRFAFDLENAGDINGDGYEDLIVGSPGTTSNTGTVAIWYSNTSQSAFISAAGTSSSTANWDYISVSSSSRLGHSVAAAGDINADGYLDIIVGDQNLGEAYVFLNTSSGLPSSYSWKATHSNASSKFGAAVSGGDLDGDGYSDIVVGAPQDNSSTIGGAIYVWYGNSNPTAWSTNPATGADWGEIGGSPNIKFGYEVYISPSIDGDNLADLAIGIQNYDYNDPSGIGAVKIYHGNSQRHLDCRLTTINAPSHSGSDAEQEFGTNFASLSDINSDGSNEIVISAKRRDITGVDEGEVFVELGTTMSSALGKKATAGGDLNGDGYGDLVVVNESSSLLQVCYGSASGYSTTPDWETYICDLSSATLAGDVNGDGYSDILVGCPEANSNDGVVYVYLGSSSGLTSAEWEMNGSGSEMLGSALAMVGDGDGDGKSEILVGASGTYKVYVWDGTSIVSANSGTASSGNVLYTGVSGSGIGLAVSSAGDFNNDGYYDILLGDGVNAKAYLFISSGSGYSSTPTWTSVWSGSVPTGSEFGSSVACAGDINTDGYSDIIVGDPGRSSEEGYIHLWLGSSTPGSMTADPDNADDIILGGQTGARFGEIVSVLGDFNIDGYADVLVGAPNYDEAPYSDCGRVSVLYGSPYNVFDDQSDITGGASSNHLGQFVSNAGDIDGDGFSDIVYGASSVNFTLKTAEPDYLASAYNAIDVASANTGSDNAYGSSMINIGDVNGDGFDDFAVGSPEEGYPGVSGQSGGVVYVYYGSESGVITSQGDFVTYKGFSSEFGYSISGGDLNGDGYSDLVIGAPNSTGCILNNPGTGSTYPNREKFDGKVFVFLGSSSGPNGGVSANHSQADWIISGGNKSSDASRIDGIGAAVTVLDIDGNGFGDLVTAQASSLISGSSYESVISIFYGDVTFPAMSGCNMTTQASTQYDIQIKRPEAEYIRLANGGDINGDGFDDLMISYKEKSSGLEYVEVFYGGCNGVCIEDGGSGNCELNEVTATDLPNWKATIGTSSTSNYFGYAISTAGDVDADGYSDVIIGAPFANGDDGEVFVLKGSSSGLPGYNDGTTNDITSISTWSVSGSTDSYLGTSVSTAGDIDGRGYDDVIFTTGQVQDDPNEPDLLTATVYLFVSEDNGNRFATGTEYLINADWSYAFSYSSTGDAFVAISPLYTCVTTLGDYNGDGFSDIVFSAWAFLDATGTISEARAFYGNLGDNKALYTVQWQEYPVSSRDILVQNGSVSDGNASPSCKIKIGNLGVSPIGKTKGKLQWQVMGEGIPFSNASGDIHRYSEGPASTTSSILEQSTYSLSALSSLSYFRPDGSTYYVNLSRTLDPTVDIPSGHAFNWRSREAFNPCNAIDGRIYSRWMYPGQGDRSPYNFKLAEGDCREFCEYNHQAFENQVSVDHDMIESKLEVFPNPVSSNLFVNIGLNTGNARILSIEGKVIMHSINLKSNLNSIDISNLPIGFYVIEITTETDIKSVKFTKQ